MKDFDDIKMHGTMIKIVTVIVPTWLGLDSVCGKFNDSGHYQTLVQGMAVYQ
jgi:hypothetical protein